MAMATSEDEQKKLEEEIAASRLARQRRSRGLAPDGRSSLDLTKNKEYASVLRNVDQDTTSVDNNKPPADRHKIQTDALAKLTAASPSAHTGAATSRPEPMSLAAFIGGKATGPRLNRHAPQQDAHDPTQFVQRTRIDAPHPIFGRGGIGLPGLAAARSFPARESEPPSASAVSRTGRTPEPRPRRLSTPSPEKPETPSSVSPPRTTFRERTVSTPTGTATTKSAPTIGPKPARSTSSVAESQPKSTSSSTTGGGNNSPNAAISRPFTPRQQPSPSPSSPPASKSPVIVTPSLVRPIQPEPRSSLQGPQISKSHAPSTAFMRPPPQKDLTPSLSRLQGRGFVQNMVKVSSQLESPGSSPGPAENTRTGSERKSSVLDRWPGLAASPPASPTSAPMRRSRTVEPSAPTIQPSPAMSKSNSDTGKPRLDAPVPTAAERLGSATTLVVIQPKSFVVDEHGFKRGSVSSSQTSKQFDMPEPSRPLIHPTKDRAKKPKKNKTAAQDHGQSTAPESLSVAPPQSTASPSIARSPSPNGNNPVLTPAVQSAMLRSPPESTTSPSLARSPSLNGNNRSASPAVQSAMLRSPPESTTSPSLARSPSPSSNNRSVSSAVQSAMLRSPPIILPKPSVEPKPPSLASTGGGGMVGRRALPGMTQPNMMPSMSPRPVSQVESTPAPRPLPVLPSGPLPSVSHQDNSSPYIPVVHTRTSSGSRPTVMDVAQALAEPPRKLSPPPVEEKAAEPEPTPTSRPRSTMFERYSVVLPPLKEEATPDPTPVSTLTRAIGNSLVQPDFSALDAKLANREEDVVRLLEVVERKDDGRADLVHFTHRDEPPPRADISPLVKYSAPSPSKDSQTIQVDVLSIAGNTAFPLGLCHIFHDTEILAIIHRSKSRSSGLITSTVWSWQGKSGSFGSAEETKLAELAKRYGTSAVPVRQLSEPVELVQCLGGTLAIRQGSRTHWASENTAMHVVRAIHGVIFIDEIELAVRNICSGFSYIVSILNTVYVWHGQGSPAEERKAALDYGRTLTSNPDDLVVLMENENDDDDMFWMALGEEADYAKADYWRWRPSIPTPPRVWRVDANGKNAISLAHSFAHEASPHTSVYVLDCVFELFVLVPSGARGRRRDIHLALSVATETANRVASARPYTPTVHVLILPSQLPLDLGRQFRDLEETFSNETTGVPHMNLLTLQEAEAHLQTSSWSKSQLKDRNMLPLGLDDSQIP